ncbi:hypothetical protein GDO81_013940 [Engystomops pustulosus]|uniref:Uncharacterized protein n=1 Tax=Engystomops pustulosus TaxID=76066 RepID=A0AAV7B6R2_ENGPU|nr:hypothetical protein GDO81_013940 [Engystomops pustulosus]
MSAGVVHRDLLLDMSVCTTFVRPAFNLKLHGRMPAITKSWPGDSRVRFGILCALIFMCWTHVKGLINYRECVSFIVASIGYTVIICMFINSFFCSYSSLLLLWVLSIFCVTRPEETEEKSVKVEEHSGLAVKRSTSTMTSLLNGEKFIKLFQSLLYEEEILGTESESIEEKMYKLTFAFKQLRKVQIIIDSLKFQIFYQFQSPANESKRIQDLINKYEHTKVYMELRRHMLNIAQKKFSTFTVKGMALKIWLSEALEFQEKLHSTTCNSPSDIQALSFLLLGIRNDGEVIQEKLAKYEHSAQSLTATLQEMSTYSSIFHKALDERSQNKARKWHNVLTVSINEEVQQVAQRFSTIMKLNECYQAHLDGLHSTALQQFACVPLSGVLEN